MKFHLVRVESGEPLPVALEARVEERWELGRLPAFLTEDGRFSVDRLIDSGFPGSRHDDETSTLLLTDRDLEKEGCDSLFGYSLPRQQIAIVSYARLGRNPRRVRNVILHELGHLNGYRHCSDSSCLMHPSASPGEIDGRSDDACPKHGRSRILARRLLHPFCAIVFLASLLVGLNLLAVPLKPSRDTPFSVLSHGETPSLPGPFGEEPSSAQLLFHDQPLTEGIAAQLGTSATEELNRLFQLVDPPRLSIRDQDDGGAVILSQTREIASVQGDDALESASRLARQLDELLSAKGTRNSSCAACHYERKPEVLEAAYGRHWGFGPF